MKDLRYFFLFFLLNCICLCAFPQKQNIKFEHLDINSGLSQNYIYCILQDSRGFMWFGTSDGLNKYDGYKFTIFKNNAKDNNSISNNFITGIVEDSKGIIWVSTRGGGLNRYDRETNKFTHFKHEHDLQEPLRTTSNFVGLIQKQYKGQLDERADKYFNYIQEASGRMKSLIKNLLDYSRIGSKKELEQVDCNLIPENVLADLHVAIQEADAHISHESLPVIMGYPNEIKQLFQNPFDQRN
ncbi:MAG: two-component regulator propeller domain-containing protein [Ginsengibacter sp.]